ncbi:hypothetical protein TNCV_1717461 [Trichonephila clavipes]|nr:hypothetical protein TNCV_1717461 [Trichonephila clavipes]
MYSDSHPGRPARRDTDFFGPPARQDTTLFSLRATVFLRRTLARSNARVYRTPRGPCTVASFGPPARQDTTLFGLCATVERRTRDEVAVHWKLLFGPPQD